MITVTVTTVRASASLTQLSGSPKSSAMLATLFAPTGLSGIIGLTAIGGFRQRRKRLLYGIMFFCIFSVGATMSACGGGASSTGTRGVGGTPVGTYNLTVKGSVSLGSITTTRATNLTLVVQ